jgi:nucleoside-diphosphate-sugar epimerase
VATLLSGVGYIGAALLARLAALPEAWPIVGLDDFSSTPRELAIEALPRGVQLVEGDVADSACVKRAFAELGDATEVTVYHLAAQPSASVAAKLPELTERSNLTGARVLLEAAKRHNARTVVFGGSFRVYGDELTGCTVSEKAPYGRVGDLSHLSKVYVEQLAQMLGVPFVSVRLGVTYGLSPIMKTDPAFMTVPNLFCKRAVAGEALRVLEDRPMAFIHVADAAEALLAAASQQDTLAWRVVNAAPEVLTVGQVARLVQQRMAARGERAVTIEGDVASNATFTVQSSLSVNYANQMATTLDPVIDFFKGRL